MKKEAINFIWSDRKRIFRLPLTFTKYSLSKDRLFLEKGLINMKLEEIVLYRIRDISLSISLWQRIFGVGTVTVVSSDHSNPKLEIVNIKNPLEIKELIHKNVERMKEERRLRVGELIDGDDYDEDDSLNQ